LIRSVQDLALREGRSPAEMARGLVAEALKQRAAASELLRIWQDLSPREQEVTALTCLNYTNHEIAQKLILSEETVKSHLQRVLRKFGLRRKDELIRALAQYDFSAWER
jgi:DNA-binding CsgD family transcriptional regulator